MFKQKFQINPKGRDFFVGDLHGCYDLLFEYLEYNNFDFNKDRLFCVGDLIDRGPQSYKCLKLIDEPWFNTVIGNHEEFLLEYPRMQNVWMYNGGTWAIPLIESGGLKAWQDKVAELPTLIEVETEYGTVGVVHAESTRNWKENNPRYTSINLWERTKIKCMDPYTISGIDIVVVGHTPLKKIVKLGNVVYLDIGATYTQNLGLLSAYELFHNI